MNLYLICNGMMLFLYRKPTSLKPDGYRILIPQSPLHMSTQMHAVRLGTAIGAPTTFLSYSSSPQPTGFYEIQFGNGPSAKARGMKSGTTNVALYSSGNFQLFPNYGIGTPAGVAFSIDIPFPDDETPARLESYKAPPYMNGYTARDFAISPTSIPRSNVYRFQIADATQSIVLQNQNLSTDRQVMQAGPITGDVKLYLYSQPPKASLIGSPGMHLPAFNAMLGYDDLTARPPRRHTALDLQLQPGSVNGCTLLANTTPPPGLTLNDLKFLAELNANTDLCLLPILGADPAECIQGPGC